MVYLYLDDTSRVVAVDDWPNFADARAHTAPFPYFSSNPTSQYDRMGSKHYWNPEYVGQDVVRELADGFYSNSFFDFGDNFHLIDRLLKEDIWHLGLNPGSRISNVRIRLYHYSGSKRISPTDSESVKKLMAFKQGTQFYIEANLPYQFFNGVQMINASYMQHFESNSPFIQQLKDAGYRVALRFKMGPYTDINTKPLPGVLSSSLEEILDEFLEVR